MLKSLFFSLHNRKVVGKILGNKTYDFTQNFRGKQKCFAWQLTAQITQNPKLALSNLPRIQKANRMKRECFTPSKHFARLLEAVFTKDSFEQNRFVRSLSGLSFQHR